MEKFTDITSTVIPLPRQDVDTDMIIPAQFLTSISSNGFSEALFRRLRDQETDFPLNLPQYQGARILAARSNFGCGSSREHAVWALRDWGVRVVIAPSFADIFFGNAAKNGLLLITLPEKTVESLLVQSSSQPASISISLEQQQVKLADGSVEEFSYDPFRKHCLLNGLDDLDYILSHKDKIDAFHEEDKKRLFFSARQ